MAVDAEVAAIIGGCVAGAVILIAIVSVCIYLLCGKRRRRREKEQKKFRQLTPHTSPTHSQPSTLTHGPPLDPRLPKVSSNGLWMGTPGIYAATPSPAYYYGRPGGGGKAHHVMQPAVMQRASSETRLPSQRGQGLQKYHVPARRAASLQRVAGHGVYATGGSHQRIYHSQQLAGLTPVYEVMDPRNGSVYDVYQIGGTGSKTKLLQEGGKAGERHSKGGNRRVERSHSDAVVDPARRPHRASRHEAQRHSHNVVTTTNNIDGSYHIVSGSSINNTERAQVHGRGGSVREEDRAGVENPAFSVSTEKIVQDDEDKVAVVAASATDSMKLLAKNKTDDQKTVVVTTSGSESEVKVTTTTTTSTTTPGQDEQQPSSLPPFALPSETSEPEAQAKTSSLHYYSPEDDVYAIPNKEEARRRSMTSNPILARMQDMIVERAEGRPPVPATDPVTDITETAEPLLITPREGASSSGAAVIQNPIYQEVEDLRLDGKASADVTTASAETSDVRADGTSGGGLRHEVDDMAAAAAVMSVMAAGASGESGDQVDAGKVKDKAKLDTRWSVDTDATTDELSRAGKHISVTAEAFEFLDTYLSDEDGGDIHSPPKSPVLSDRDMMY